jgi:heme oxygenase (biliverdin-producing, ferredoxin)
MADQVMKGMDETLSGRLRVETQALHREAERTGIMVPLLRGRLPTPEYVRLLESLLVVYETMEAGLEEHAHHPALAPLRMPELYRTPALREDIRVLGEGARPSPLPPAATRYRERLQGLARTAPHLLGAHAWVRYMGDLSGGRMVGVVVARGLGLEGPGSPGTRFYRFPDEVDATLWKERFRGALDTLPLDAEESGALVEEARHAFRLHVELFAELAGGEGPAGPGTALVTPAVPGPPPPPEAPRSDG